MEGSFGSGGSCAHHVTVAWSVTSQPRLGVSQKQGPDIEPSSFYKDAQETDSQSIETSKFLLPKNPQYLTLLEHVGTQIELPLQRWSLQAGIFELWGLLHGGPFLKPTGALLTTACPCFLPECGDHPTRRPQRRSRMKTDRIHDLQIKRPYT